jgi:hypothetical protein
MSRDDFDLRALYDTIDAQRQARGLAWAALAREVNQHRTTLRPISASTITGLQHKTKGEGRG